MYVYLTPERAQAKKVAWPYIKDYTRWIPGSTISEADMKVTFPTANGTKATIYVDGASDPHTLRGMYIDGAILDEAAQMPPDTWNEVIRPALSDRLGWAIFIGTPKGRNFFYDKFHEALKGENREGVKLIGWKAVGLKASETGLLPQEELDAMVAEMGPEKFAQEMELDWTGSFEGSYYGKYFADLRKNGGITNVAYDPKYPVYTGWDLGGADSTCIWFAQYIHGELRLIDFYRKKGEIDLRHFVNVVQGKPYVYKKHFLPFDIEQNPQGSIGQKRIDVFRSAGMSLEVIKRVAISDGIQAVRSLLPFCKFDEKKCEYGIHAMEMYEARVDDTKGVDEQKPIHNWASHAADAFRYLALGIRPSLSHTSDKLNKEAVKNLTTFTYESYDPLQ